MSLIPDPVENALREIAEHPKSTQATRLRALDRLYEIRQRREARVDAEITRAVERAETVEEMSAALDHPELDHDVELPASFGLKVARLRRR